MENIPHFQQWLRPAPERHVPLTHNFYEQFLRKNPGYNESMETPSAPSTPNTSTGSAPSTKTSTNKSTAESSVTSKLVKEIMESNKQLIEAAAMQRRNQLSFDEEEFNRNHEASRKRK
uniref:Mediator of RNA polymerase II transcription subunit 8 n=1 Tax=Caenorhabditis tropicalis TaxID=1561998 RepID=A0A1I7T244_9PELO